jgi:hypothetical protein
MSYRCAEESLKSVASIPVYCSHCQQARELAPHSEALDCALVNATYLHELTEELVLLHRAHQLFARFPESRHGLKVTKEAIGAGARSAIASDPQFDEALRADPALHEFLAESSFYLPARMQAVRECIAELETKIDRGLVGCPACRAGWLRIEPAFFETL